VLPESYGTLGHILPIAGKTLYLLSAQWDSSLLSGRYRSCSYRMRRSKLGLSADDENFGRRGGAMSEVRDPEVVLAVLDALQIGVHIADRNATILFRNQSAEGIIGATATATPKAGSVTTKYSTTSRCIGSPTPAPLRSASTGK